jgi:hypothetical protein
VPVDQGRYDFGFLDLSVMAACAGISPRSLVCLNQIAHDVGLRVGNPH